MTLTVALFLEIAAHCDFLHFLRYTNMFTYLLTLVKFAGNFVGGVPDARLMTAGKFLHGFVGCISDVYIQALGPIDFSEHAVGGVNVQPCYL